MRKLFAALTKLTFADHFGFSGNVLGKYPNYRATKCRLFVEKARGRLFDFLSQIEKLLHTRAAFCSLRSREFIKRGIADLTHDNLVVVQHGKPEGSSVLVVSFDSMANQRHGLYSPRTGTTPRLRVHQLAPQINSFGGQPLSRLCSSWYWAAKATAAAAAVPLPVRFPARAIPNRLKAAIPSPIQFPVRQLPTRAVAEAEPEAAVPMPGGTGPAIPAEVAVAVATALMVAMAVPES